MKRFSKILFGIFIAVELILMFAINYLEKLAYQKAGVNHHLYFKKGEYMFKYLKPENVKFMTILIAILAIIYLIVLVISIKNSRKIIALESAVALIWSTILEYSLHSASVMEKLVYPYLILALFICIVLSTINILISKKA